MSERQRSRHEVRAGISLVALVLGTASLFAVGAGSAAAATTQYTQPGSYELAVPSAATCATVVVDGAHGGAANTLGRPDSAGGPGGEVTLVVSVSAPQTLQLTVGGHGGDATDTTAGTAGANGGAAGGLGHFQDADALSGGGGGGSSAVELDSTLLAVAGGGGGGGSNLPGAGDGGTGGAGGSFIVGSGMGRDGAPGGDDPYGFSKGGGGGTGTTGGAGGAAGSANAAPGEPGSGSTGGAGGFNTFDDASGGGGGGGGGYFGGGGGGAGDGDLIEGPGGDPGSGGGGGSSYVATGVQIGTFGAAPDAGDGSITVTFTSGPCPPPAPPAPPVPDATQIITLQPRFTG